MSRILLKAANGLVNFIVILALCLAGLYAAFALWDNSRIYAAAEDVQADMIRMKPKIQEGESGPSFAELLDVNPDVCAWVTMDGTKIDHPVLQGETNLDYLNTDVYGNFALAGSIFLDYRCESTFAAPYSLLYGHHMANSGMFGDLDLYKDQAFFEENTTGMLLLPDGAYRLETFACLLVSASDDNIFDPDRWGSDIGGLGGYARENAMYLHEHTLQALEEAEKPQVLALSTCASEFTDARTIVLCRMTPWQK